MFRWSWKKRIFVVFVIALPLFSLFCIFTVPGLNLLSDFAVAHPDWRWLSPGLQMFAADMNRNLTRHARAAEGYDRYLFLFEENEWMREEETTEEEREEHRCNVIYTLAWMLHEIYLEDELRFYKDFPVELKWLEKERVDFWDETKWKDLALEALYLYFDYADEEHPQHENAEMMRHRLEVGGF